MHDTGDASLDDQDKVNRLAKEPGRDIPPLYEEIAEWFDAGRNRHLMEKEYLSLAVSLAPEVGTMLDLGCGGGEPIARYFIERGFRITGLDTSPKMISFCRQRFPDQTWFVGDMRALKLDSRFDIIFAWDSFFHLDQDFQRGMFPIFRNHAADGGVLVFTTGPKKGEVYGTMEGRDFYHASLDPVDYRKQLVDHGFTVVLNRIEDPSCGGRTVWVASWARPPATP